MDSLLTMLHLVATLFSLRIVSGKTSSGSGTLQVWEPATHYSPCTTAPVSEPWPHGIVPYSFSSELPEAMRAIIQASMQAVESALCVTFIPRHDQQDYLLLEPGERCCSHIGKVGFGRQILFISEWCINETIVTILQQVAGIISENHCNGYCREVIDVDIVDINTSGTISSTNFPESNYPPNSNCVYKFWIPSDATVVFDFQAFHLEYERNCRYDFLEITEQDELGYIINQAVLCGELQSHTFESFGRSVTIRFYSDSDYEASGFQLKYETFLTVENCSLNNGGCSQVCLQDDSSNKTACSCFDGYYLSQDNRTCLDIDECMHSRGGCQQRCNNLEGSYYCHCKPGYGLSTDNHTCVECGGVITDTHGEFTSPNYPLTYPHHQFCHWTILVQPGYCLKINITDLDIQANGRCDIDYLKTQHGRFSRKGRLCGSHTMIAYYLRDIYSTEFTFRTHTITTQYSGFRLTYTQVPISNITTEELNRVYIDNRTIHYNTNRWI